MIFLACCLATRFTAALTALLLAILLLGLPESILLAIIRRRRSLAVITVMAVFGVRAITGVPEFGLLVRRDPILARAVAYLHLVPILVAIEGARTLARNFVGRARGPHLILSAGRCYHHNGC